MNSPEVSVVMGVYNGADHLEETLSSVLSQEGCNLEFIVIDDGSTDDTRFILDQWATRDSRLRVIRQENAGLTRALMLGCLEARGEFIARQDAGDVSLPGRFAAQCEFLSDNPNVVMVSGGVQFVGPKGEALYDVIRCGEELELGLSQLDVDTIVGPPHHGCTMYRRSAYFAAGGYRSAFVVAQDIDLWLRLAEQGILWGLSEIQYLARVAANSISSRRRDDQFRAATLGIECAKLRRSGHSDQPLIDEGMSSVHQGGGCSSRYEKSRFYYFVGACLSKTDSRTARLYFLRSLLTNPLSLKALARCILG